METSTALTTLDIGEARLTVPTEALFLAWLQNTLAGSAAPTISASAMKPPRIGEEWPEQGGHYAGVMRGIKGRPDYHLIVPAHQDASILEIVWGGQGIDQPGATCEYDGLANTIALLESNIDHPAAEWASDVVIDGHSDLYLPARRELRLAYINVPELFEGDWHWSSTQHAAGSDYAWMQDFSDGCQHYDGKSYARRARAFRRLNIQ